MKRAVAIILLGVMLCGFVPAYAETMLSLTESFFAEAENEELQIFGDALTLPVYKTKGEVTIDGDYSEWTDTDEFPMLYRSLFGVDTEATATVRLMYDEEKLYILIVTEDEKHFVNPDTARYWNGDCAQFVLTDVTSGAFGTQVGIAYYPESGTTYTTPSKNITAQVKRKGNETIYEIAADWTLHFGERPDDMLFCAAIADGDNIDGRETTIEMRPGIVTGKQSSQYQRFVFLEDEKSFYAYIDGERKVRTAEEYNYNICIYNETEKTETYKIKSQGEELSLTVEAGKVGMLPRTTAFDGSADIGIAEAEISCGDEELKINHKVTVEANEAYYLKLKERLEGYVTELKEMINKCNLSKLSTDYEEQAVGVIEFYIKEIAIDYSNGDFSRMIHYSKVFEEIYNTTKADLEAYLNGDKTPVRAVKIVNGEYGSENYAFTAETTDGRRPVFYTGAMLEFNWSINTIEDLPDMGINYIYANVGATYNLKNKGVISPYPSTWGKGTNQYLPDEIHESAEVYEDENGNHYAVLSSDHDMNDYPNISSHYGFTQWIEVEAGEVYEFGAKIKADNVQFAHLSLSGQKTGIGTIENMGGTYDWKEVRGEYVASTAARVPVCIRSWGYGTFMADDVYVRNKRTGENLVINGDFEHDKYVQGERSGRSFFINPDYFEDLDERLEAAYKKNLPVCIQLGYPSFYELREMDDTITEGGASSPFATFVKFNPHHPIILDGVDAYIDAVCERYKDYDNIQVFCLANEPEFFANRSEFYKPYWQEYLKSKYETIEKLNETLHTSYESFEEVIMPKEVSADELFVEYASFNNKILTDIWRIMSERIHKTIPDAKITVKTLHYALDKMERGADSSNDYEAWIEYLDYNGNDGLGYNYEDENQLIRTEFWFDYQASIKKAPVMDLEDHLLPDRSIISYDEEIPNWVESSIWQNPIHYVGCATTWLWDRENYPHYAHSAVNYRPDAVYKFGRATMDMNRLSYEITAIQNEAPKVALLYNQYSLNNNQYEMNAMFHAYKAAIFAGQKVGFIVNSQLDKLDNYDFLVLGVGSYMPKETFEAVYKFVKRGGKLLILDPQTETETAFLGDIYHEKLDEAKVEEILQAAEILPITAETTTLLTEESQADIKDKMQKIIDELELNSIRVIDEETGKPVEMAEIAYAPYDGGYVINILNHEWEKPKTVRFEVDGKAVAEIKDLRSNVTENGTITVEPYSAKLIKLEMTNKK